MLNKNAIDEYKYLNLFASRVKALNNFGENGIRLLYSPVSRILCIHLFNLYPYPMSAVVNQHVYLNEKLKERMFEGYHTD